MRSYSVGFVFVGPVWVCFIEDGLTLRPRRSEVEEESPRGQKEELNIDPSGPIAPLTDCILFFFSFSSGPKMTRCRLP